MPRPRTLAHAITGETDQAAWKGKQRSFKAARVWMKGLSHSEAGFEHFSRAMSPDVPVPNESTVPTVSTVWVDGSQSWNRPVRSG